VVSAVAAVDGSEVLRVVMDRQRGVEAEALGRKVAEELLRQGAARLLGSGAAMGSVPGSGPVGAA
jgi:porphobilinogen deaminase